MIVIILLINAVEYRLFADKHLLDTHHLSHVIFSRLKF